jgi:hypothetical protein
MAGSIFIGSGNTNKVFSDYSFVVSGKENGATGGFSGVIGGKYNNVTGAYSVIIGGLQNKCVYSNNCTILSGSYNKIESNCNYSLAGIRANIITGSCNAISIGFGTCNVGTNTIAFGTNALANTANSIAIGNAATNTNTGTSGICIGASTCNTGTNGIAIGVGANSTAAESVSIGHGVSNAITNSIALGTNSARFLQLDNLSNLPPTITQITSNSTAVTLNHFAGKITMFGTLAANTAATFTFNNTRIASTSVILLTARAISTTGDKPCCVGTTAIFANFCQITIFNTDTANATTAAPTIHFTILYPQ